MGKLYANSQQLADGGRDASACGRVTVSGGGEGGSQGARYGKERGRL